MVAWNYTFAPVITSDRPSTGLFLDRVHLLVPQIVGERLKVRLYNSRLQPTSVAVAQPWAVNEMLGLSILALRAPVDAGPIYRQEKELLREGRLVRLEGFVGDHPTLKYSACEGWVVGKESDQHWEVRCQLDFHPGAGIVLPKDGGLVSVVLGSHPGQEGVVILDPFALWGWVETLLGREENDHAAIPRC